MALTIPKIDFAGRNFAAGASVFSDAGAGYTFPANGLYDIQVAMYNVAGVAGDWLASVRLLRWISEVGTWYAFEPKNQVIGAGADGFKILPLNSVLAQAGEGLHIDLTSPNWQDEAVSGHVLIAQRTLAVPGVAPGEAGGLPTVDASNFIAGVQGAGYRVDAIAGYISPTLTAVAVLKRHGQRIVANGACTVTLFSAAGVQMVQEIDAAADANGVFRIAKASPGLVAGNAYYATISIVHGGVTIPDVQLFTAR